MKFSELQNEMQELCQRKQWRTLIELLDEGYRGIFVILRILQESKTDVFAGDLSKRMNVSTARVASALNVLESKKYVKRESEKSDARKIVVRLTPQGANALEERKRLIEEKTAPLFNNLTDDEFVTMFALLKKFLR